MVAIFLCFFVDSGMSSAPTTPIIAPALKANRKGSILCTLIASSAPITPAIGSTIPLACP